MTFSRGDLLRDDRVVVVITPTPTPARGPALASRVLSALVGLPIAETAIVRDAKGKPRLAGDEIRFSVSHCAGVACVAASRRRDVGVDIQEPANVTDRFLHRFFSREEVAWIDSDGPGRARRLARLWAIREAAVKVRGGGLGSRMPPIDGPAGDAGRYLGVSWTSFPAGDLEGVMAAAGGEALAPMILHGTDLAGMREAHPPSVVTS